MGREKKLIFLSTGLESCAEEQTISKLWPYYINGNDVFNTKVMETLEENKKKLVRFLHQKC